MSVDLVLFSPLPPSAMSALESRCDEHIGRWYEQHPEVESTWGPLVVGGYVPSPEQAHSLVWVDGEPAPAGHPKVDLIRERLGTIRSAMTIERPGNIAAEPLEVAVLDFLVREVGQGLVLMGDVLEPIEDFALWLRQHPAAPDFASSAPARPRPSASRMSLLAMLAEDLDDDDDDFDGDADEVEDAPGLVAARGFVRTLVSSEQVILSDDADEREVGERLLAFFEKMDATRIGRAVGDWLLDQPEVEELFADDNAIEDALRRHFSSGG